MAHEIFISHAYKDKGIADAICRKLESANVRCWIAPRNISVGEDWTKAICKAIGSSRVVVLVLSENANAATHIEREIANAFYAGLVIIPFRLDNAIPRRNFLPYLGGVRWLDSVNPPAEQNLEELTACIKGMLVGVGAPCGDPPLQGAMRKTANLPESSQDRIKTILKRVVTTASVSAVILLLWLVSEQGKQNVPPEATSLQSRRSDVKASRVQGKEDASASVPHYTFTRLGLWEPVNPSPTPAVEAGPQEPPAATSNATSAPSNVDLDAGAKGESGAVPGSAIGASRPNNPPRMAHRRERHRERLRPKSERSGFAYIRGWLTGIWRKMQ
jgi:hypothetical protein